MSNGNSRNILLSVLGVAILVVAVVGVSFAAFTFSKAGTVENTISTGTIAMTYTEGTAIQIDNAMPMTDDQGKVQTGDGKVFSFTVGATITGTTTINYEISAIKKTGSTIPDADIRLYLEKAATVDGAYSQAFAPAAFVGIASATDIGSPAGSMVLESGTFNATTTNYYKLRMWLASTAEITGTAQTYTVTVNVNAKQQAAA